MASSRDQLTGSFSWRFFLRPRNAILTAIGLVILIQLIPVWLLQTNPPARAEPPWNSASTRLLAQETCFDCHSNFTVWPWYSRIAPVSWLVTQDVIRGRRHLNFSEWQSGPQDSFLMEQVASAIQRGAMPPSYYVWMHPNANLSAAQKQQLIQGLERSLN
jgi:cytochrome c551/c552